MRIKALQLTANSAFQLWFGSLLASTLGAQAVSVALLAAAERRSVRRREMDCLSFVASVIDSIAWPTVVIVLALLFRRPLGQVIRGLTRARYKDFELEFGKRLEELDARAEAGHLPEPTPSPTAPATARSVLAPLAEISPRAAVAEAWRQVEHAIDDYFARLNQPRPPSYQGMVRVLRSKHPVVREALALIQDLRVLRNQAVHAREFDLDTEEALKFADLADRVTTALRMAPLEDYPH